MTPGFNTNRRYANVTELDMLFVPASGENNSPEEACLLGCMNPVV